ncbi:MAG: hypoxanthine phosphoribosyltransferase [Bacteroidales bacterium]|nr:hypoxanthine phosphoribosyltransferase [Bacteroidales bacterium]
MKTKKVKDRIFEEFIGEKQIQEKVQDIARQIDEDHTTQDLLFISILNGSYVFTADLLRNIERNVRVSFLKLSSYEGLESSGNVRRLIGLGEDLTGRTVIIIEDIIDTGRTLDGVIDDIKEKGATDIKVAVLLLKPEAYNGSHKIDYTGFEIPNDFVIGYGLDWDGYGRNFRSIYRITDRKE